MSGLLEDLIAKVEELSARVDKLSSRPDRLWSLDDIAKHMGVSRSTALRTVARPDFPPPVQVFGSVKRRKRWNPEDVREFRMRAAA